MIFVLLLYLALVNHPLDVVPDLPHLALDDLVLVLLFRIVMNGFKSGWLCNLRFCETFSVASSGEVA